MAAEYDNRSKYLTLALEARRVVDLLLPLAEKGERAPSLLPSLSELIGSLESGGSAETLLERLRAPGRRPIYEELLTDEDLESSEERTNLVHELRKVVTEETDPTARMESARKAILLLCTVEGRALHHFSRFSEADNSFSLAV